MITNIILALLLLTVAAIAFYRHRRSLGEFFANVVTITSVNTFQEGRKTYLADNPFTSRYLLAKVGTDASHIDICGAADVPLGVVPDMTPTTDVGGNLTYPLPVNLFPVTNTTERLIACGTGRARRVCQSSRRRPGPDNASGNRRLFRRRSRAYGRLGRRRYDRGFANVFLESRSLTRIAI